ncbi:DUF4232 domain-containing protein [Streptomyces sp. NPDC021749]|uniref:DUF4232 domain-containing protein n=1 Tax=Streptomyces sp. NPDC021749 TaxID=3154905 RepID=UPI0034026B4A
MRIARYRTRLVASAAVLAAALSRTACGNDSKDTGSKDTGSMTPVASSQTTASGEGALPSPDAKGKAGDGGSSKNASRASGSGNGHPSGPGQAAGKGTGKRTGKGSGSHAAIAACTGAQVKVTVTKVNRPLNHLLLTATNTGSMPCYAYAAPYLRWDGAQAATAFLDKSRPQAVVTLEPGKSAYAGIMYQSADGSGNSAYTARTLGVLFANRAENGSTGPAVRLALPKGGITTDSSA